MRKEFLLAGCPTRSNETGAPVWVNVARERGVLLVEANGRLDGRASDRVKDAVERALSPSDRVLVLDFSGLDYLSSSGLRALLLLGRLMRRSGRDLVVWSMTLQVRDVLEISGFNTLITTAGDREAALRIAAGGQTF